MPDINHARILKTSKMPGGMPPKRPWPSRLGEAHHPSHVVGRPRAHPPSQTRRMCQRPEKALPLPTPSPPFSESSSSPALRESHRGALRVPSLFPGLLDRFGSLRISARSLSLSHRQNVTHQQACVCASVCVRARARACPRTRPCGGGGGAAFIRAKGCN